MKVLTISHLNAFEFIFDKVILNVAYGIVMWS